MGGGILLIINLLFLLFDFDIRFYIGAKELLASVFMLTGYYFKRESYHFEEKYLITIPIGIIMVAIGAAYWPCGMASLTWQNLIPYYITALFGTYVIFSMCKWLSRNKTVTTVLTNIGDKTLDILTWHFLAFKLVSFVIILFYGMNISHLAEFPVIEDYSYKGWFILYLTIGVLIPLLIERVCSICNKSRYFHYHIHKK